MSESVEEFLKRGGKINVVPMGASAEVPIIISKQPDGTIRNDWHQQEKSRKRPRLSTSVMIFPQPKKKISASGHMYIRCKMINGVMHYKVMIRDMAKSEWIQDLKLAVEIRNESLRRMGEPLPD